MQTVYILFIASYFMCFINFTWNFFGFIYLFYVYEYTVAVFRHTRRGHWIITDGCEPPCGCWELNSGPLEEQSLLLTAEPSLQPCKHTFWRNFLPTYLPPTCDPAHAVQLGQPASFTEVKTRGSSSYMDSSPQHTRKFSVLRQVRLTG